MAAGKVVVIGGGAVGTSILYHRALVGVTDTILLLSKRDDDLLELKSDKQRDMAPPRPKAFLLKTVVCGMDEDLDPMTTCVMRSADAAELKAKPKPRGSNQELLMECYTQLRLAGIGEPNPGGPQASQSSRSTGAYRMTG